LKTRAGVPLSLPHIISNPALRVRQQWSSYDKAPARTNEPNQARHLPRADMVTRTSPSSRPPPSSPRPPSLHQRILYPFGTSPRILHSSAYATLDPLLLDLIALICREHVLTWYSSISRDPDRAFIQQVSSILIHVIQALEVRLAQVDVVGLVVVDLPSLLEVHLRDWDQAVEKAQTGHAHNLGRDEVFHALQPHIAISLVPTQLGQIPVVDKTYLRALVDNLLRLLLLPEDFQAETERAIVREIIVNIILGGVFTKVAQPWFLHQIIARQLEERQGITESTKVSAGVTVGSTSRILDGLASIPSVVGKITSSISALYHTAMDTPSTTSSSDHLTATPILSLLTALLPPSTLLAQAVHYIQLPIALFSPFFTSLVYHSYKKEVNSKFVARILEITTRSLFPDRHPPPKEADPDEDGKVDLKRRCEAAVAQAVPGASSFHSRANLTDARPQHPSRDSSFPRLPTSIDPSPCPNTSSDPSTRTSPTSISSSLSST
jgi:hypothetical protein